MSISTNINTQIIKHLEELNAEYISNDRVGKDLLEIRKIIKDKIKL